MLQFIFLGVRKEHLLGVRKEHLPRDRKDALPEVQVWQGAATPAALRTHDFMTRSMIWIFIYIYIYLYIYIHLYNVINNVSTYLYS